MNNDEEDHDDRLLGDTLWFPVLLIVVVLFVILILGWLL